MFAVESVSRLSCIELAASPFWCTKTVCQDTIMQSLHSKENVTTPARILIVEDVENVATVLQARLESYGYEVCDVADSGTKAIADALKYNPDVILMDILLKGDINGIEAAQQINRHLSVPIIYLSCVNDQQVLNQAIQTNPYGFILKPYDNEELRFSIENALIKHGVVKAYEKRISELEKAP